jgi:plastocyanin
MSIAPHASRRVVETRNSAQGIHVLLAMVIASLILAACGQPKTKPPVVRILGDSRSFSSPALIVDPGTTIVWHNQDHQAHTVTTDPTLAVNAAHGRVPHGVEPWHSGLILAGQYWTHTFTTAGEYVYFCQFHEAEQMIGSIVVREP